MLQIIPRTKSHPSWQFHDNPLCDRSLMWLTDRQKTSDQMWQHNFRHSTRIINIITPWILKVIRNALPDNNWTEFQILLQSWPRKHLAIIISVDISQRRLNSVINFHHALASHELINTWRLLVTIPCVFWNQYFLVQLGNDPSWYLVYAFLTVNDLFDIMSYFQV